MFLSPSHLCLQNSSKWPTLPLPQELIFRMNLNSSVKLLTCSLCASSVWYYLSGFQDCELVLC